MKNLTEININILKLKILRIESDNYNMKRKSKKERKHKKENIKKTLWTVFALSFLVSSFIYQNYKKEVIIALQYTVGIIYSGLKDHETAFYWTEKAAKKGNSWAQNDLGIKYYKGRGIQKDREKAFYWIQKSAKGGHILARYNLKVLFKDDSKTSE